MAMTRVRWLAPVTTAIALVGLSHPSRAADTTPQWQFFLTPYLWTAGVGGNVSSSIPQLNGQPVDAGFGKIFNHLNSIPVMGAAEARYGSFGVYVDFIAIGVGTKFSVPSPYFSGGKANLNADVGSLVGFYRALDLPAQRLDVGLGVRAFGLSTKFSLSPGLLPGASVEPGGAWAAPIAAARYNIDLSYRWNLTAQGDVGAGPSNPLSLQLLGTINYRVTPTFSLRAGYRYLRLAFDAAGQDQHVTVSGPIIGGTLRF